MSITWKKKFKPDLILQRIDSVRSISSEGAVSFSGDFFEHLPVLGSMLNFPDGARRVNKSSLIWSALSRINGDLNKSAFESAINMVLKKELSTSIKPYVLVTSLSLGSKNIPRSINVLGSRIEFYSTGVPKKFNGHNEVIKKHKILIQDTPKNYLYARIAIREKSPTAAAQKAIDHLDLFRGLIAFYANMAMELNFFGNSLYEPINRVRCGSRHTLHNPDGKLATDSIWFEPNYRPAKIFELNDPKSIFARIKHDLIQIAKSNYSKELADSLIKYARAFDEPDANAAFVKLWSALELLTTPGIADYDKLVKRCSFLFTNGEFHQQVLEHLRDYRNRSVHSGIEDEDGRTNCFMLQNYYRRAIHFYNGNRKAFSTLDEANEFLDLPSNELMLRAKLKAISKAIRFITPRP